MNNPKDRRVEIDIRESPITLVEVKAAMLIMSKMNPEREYFMDGDAYAIVSQLKVKG